MTMSFSSYLLSLQESENDNVDTEVLGEDGHEECECPLMKKLHDECHKHHDDDEEHEEKKHDEEEEEEKKKDDDDDKEEDSYEESAEFPVDESGFAGFGVDKLKAPSAEGLAAGKSAMDQFVSASDGKDTDVDWSFHASFPKDSSGFEKDANSEIEPEEVKVDPNTVPAVPEEKDQFSDPNEGEDVSDNAATPAELAKDDDDVVVEESTTGWDDLF